MNAHTYIVAHNWLYRQQDVNTSGATVTLRVEHLAALLSRFAHHYGSSYPEQIGHSVAQKEPS